MKGNRYLLPADKLVNRLAPYYLCGRKHILFLQSMVAPLKTLNGEFCRFAGEKHIEARMTSQVMYFEWFLNHKFSKYLKNGEERITLSEGSPLGADIYRENSLAGKPFTVWYNLQEIPVTLSPEENPREFYYLMEEKTINKVSFLILVPEITLPQKEFVQMLSYVTDTYRIAGKTYLIRINDTEIDPNQY